MEMSNHAIIALIGITSRWRRSRHRAFLCMIVMHLPSDRCDDNNRHSGVRRHDERLHGRFHCRRIGVREHRWSDGRHLLSPRRRLQHPRTRPTRSQVRRSRQNTITRLTSLNVNCTDLKLNNHLSAIVQI